MADLIPGRGGVDPLTPIANPGGPFQSAFPTPPLNGPGVGILDGHVTSGLDSVMREHADMLHPFTPGGAGAGR